MRTVLLLGGLWLLVIGAAVAQVLPAAAPAPASSASSEAMAASAAAPAASAASAIDQAPAAAASSVTFAPVVVVEPPPARRVAAPWFDDALGPDPAAWRYSAALEALAASGQADALRRVLLRRHVAQALGDAATLTQTVRQALAEGEGLPPPDRDADLRGRWIELVNRHLQAAATPAGLPLPPELEADAARLREAAPGLWSLHAADGTLRSRIWWLLLHNRATVPLALAEFRVRAPAGPEATVWDCALPRYAETNLVAPGRATAYLCRGSAATGTPRGWTDLAGQVRAGRPPPLRLEPVDLSDANAVQRLYGRLEGPLKAEAEALARRLPGPSASAAAAAQTRAAGGAGVPGDSRSWAERARLAGLAMVGMALYALLVAALGRRTAITVNVLLLTALALAAAFNGLPASWSLLPTVDLRAPAGLLRPLLMALAAPVLATAALAVVYELLFGPNIGLLRAAGQGVGGRLADAVMDRVFRGRLG